MKFYEVTLIPFVYVEALHTFELLLFEDVVSR